ncbi:hypothetical protein BDV12DRAFT_34254 [Aspergillus spectabilis]
MMETRKLRAGAKACHSCRRRKVRCQVDSGMTKCRACYRRSSACILTNPQPLTEDQQATVLQLASAPVEGVFAGLPTSDLPASRQRIESTHDPTFLPPVLHQLESLFDPEPAAADPLSSLLCFSLPRSLVSRPGSSPFSIFSPEGKQWLHKAVGNEVFNWDILSPFAFGPDATFDNTPSPSRLPEQFIHLPSKDVARSLLRTYFQGFNSFCPTFEEQDFMLRFELEYPIRPESSELWACLNATLALACLLDQHFRSKAWLFWKNAMLSWEAFITHAPSLLSAQALLTMTLYLLGTFHSNPSSTMIPMAIRMLSGVSPTSEGMSQQFHMVGMLTRSLDIDHALQAGLPPTELGAEHSIDPVGFEAIVDPSMPFDCYPAICRLIELKQDIYRDLYSISAQGKTDYEAISIVGQLDARLEQWKDDIPEKYRPGHPKAHETIKQGISDTVLHIHLSYYNCVLVIHRRSFPNTTWSTAFHVLPTTSQAVRSPNPRVLKSTQLCAEAARATLRLVKYIPKDNPLIRGVMFNYVVFALKLFVILTVQDPRSPRACADILLMRSMEDVLGAIPITGEDRSIQKLIEYCAAYRDVAERAINQVVSRKRHREYDDTEDYTSYRVP